MTLTQEEHDRRRKAYDESRSDAEAAKKIDMSKLTFFSWRVAAGLSNKYNRHLSAEEDQRRMEVYHDCLNDRNASRKLGIHASTFASWRKYHELPPKRIWSGSFSYDIEDEPIFLSQRIVDIRAWRRAGMSWGEIGRLLHLNPQSCQSILHRAYTPNGEGCMRWDMAIKDASPRLVRLLDQFGGCAH